MKDAEPRSFLGLKNRSTRYEVVARHRQTDARVVVGFTSKLSRSGLLKVLQSRGEELIAFTGMPEDARFTMNSRTTGSGRRFAFALAGDWIFEFTGRTERECRMANHAGRTTVIRDVGGLSR